MIHCCRSVRGESMRAFSIWCDAILQNSCSKPFLVTVGHVLHFHLEEIEPIQTPKIASSRGWGFLTAAQTPSTSFKLNAVGFGPSQNVILLSPVCGWSTFVLRVGDVLRGPLFLQTSDRCPDIFHYNLTLKFKMCCSIMAQMLQNRHKPWQDDYDYAVHRWN